MSAPLLLDLSHTSHTRARTGIQRMARAIHAELGAEAVPVTHDPYQHLWRELEPWELSNLAATSPSPKRSARWPLGARLRGQLRRLVSGRPVATACAPSLARATRGTLVVEIFSPAVAAALPALFAANRGPRVALFFDAIALQYPEFTPAKTVARYPAYMRELLAFDGIAAISETSRDALLDYWRWLGVRDIPPVVAIIPGVDPPAPSVTAAAPISSSALPTVLCVGTLEARKNHLALLDACEQLWCSGARFSLHLIGVLNRETGRAASERILALQALGRPLSYKGALDEALVHAAYAACTFTVYPSRVEGFGLPVVESLAHGKPCICSSRGPLGATARGGGCIALDSVDAASLAGAIGRLLASPDELATLGAAARTRTFPTWRSYTSELGMWLNSLRRRN